MLPRLTMCILLALPHLAFADGNPTDIADSTVSFVNQLDSNELTFEFGSNITHACGSTAYRVKSPNTPVASRKFAIVLSAFTSGKKLWYHDTGVCEGNRSVVTWVRVAH